MSEASSTPDADFCANAAERVRALINLTDDLARIFEEENLALANSRPDDLAPLQAEKARLAAAYAQSIRAVAADRAGVAAVEESLLSRLREATEGFEARAARQKSLLERAAAPDSEFVQAL